MVSAIGFHCRIVVSAANWFSLSNCDVSSELVLIAELRCQQRIDFRCRIVVLLANWFSLPNHGVSSEPIFIAKLWHP
jgi:hypothetical protein